MSLLFDKPLQKTQHIRPKVSKVSAADEDAEGQAADSWGHTLIEVEARSKCSSKPGGFEGSPVISSFERTVMSSEQAPEWGFGA